MLAPKRGADLPAIVTSKLLQPLLCLYLMLAPYGMPWVWRDLNKKIITSDHEEILLQKGNNNNSNNTFIKYLGIAYLLDSIKFYVIKNKFLK